MTMTKTTLYACPTLALNAGLVFLPTASRAENVSAATGATSESGAATYLELMVTTHAQPAKPIDGKPDSNLMSDAKTKATQSGIEKAIKLNAEYAALYPKCHFRISTIATMKASEQPMDFQPMPPPQPGMPPVLTGPLINLRVTLVGDSGCLTAAK